VLFSESNSRFLVEVAPGNKENFEEVMAATALGLIGQVTDTDVLEVYGLGGKRVVNVATGELKEAWQKPLRW